MKKTKIVYLEHCIDHTIGGSHYCLLEICRALDKERYDATVVFYEENDLVSEFRETGFKVRIEKPFQASKFGQNLPAPLGRVLRLPVNYFNMMVLRVFKWRQILQQEKADVLHLNNTFSTDHDALIAAKSLKIPVVSHVRGIEPRINKLGLLFGRYLDRIIAISNAVKQNLLNQGVSDNNITLIYDGINENRITDGVKENYINTEYDLKAGHTIFGVVGNIKPWKGQKLLVEAVALLKEKYNNFSCFLIGDITDTHYRAEIEALIEKHDIQDHIVITGYQKNVPDFVNSFDVFVHTSVEPEPFGIVIIEALALKKAVIVSNIGAPQEIIEDGKSGLLFNIESVTDLADKLDSLIRDEARRKALGEAGYLRFRENFTISINVEGICGVYDEVKKT
ncbi:MAG: glycosyltransferase family 4 protein [Candidatus Thiodiazotropha sp. DIVDIV]